MAKKDKDWEKKLEKEATEDSAREKAGSGGLGNNLSIKGSRFTYGDEKIGKEFIGVIVDFVYLNAYYDSKYKDGEVNIPTCFALSENGEDMEPHENVIKSQSDACEGCPKNEWKSGKGRGKACQNRRRLAIIHVDDIEDVASIADAEAAALTLPVTSIKNWSAYIKELKNKTKRPIYSVKTKLGFDEDAEYPVVTFELDEKLDEEEIIDAIKERRDDIREMLMTPWEDSEDDGKKKKGKKAEKDDDDDDDDDEKVKKKSSKKEKDDDDDEDEEDDESDDDDDEDDDEDSGKKKSKKAGKDKSGGKKRNAKDDDDDDDDDEDDDEDDEDEKEDDEDEDDDDEKPRKKRKSRFGK